MNKVATEYKLKDLLLECFHSNEQDIINGDQDFVTDLRRRGLEKFEKNGFPGHPMENWRNTDIGPALKADYYHEVKKDIRNVDINQIFQCQVRNFETFLVSQLNGWYVYKEAPLRKLDNGVIVGSLREAFLQYPELMSKHYGQYAKMDSHGLVQLNTAFVQDGFFIYVPDNVEMDIPIQMVNITQLQQDLLIFPRNLIILGESSKLKLVHCDDSENEKDNFINAVSEFVIGENANLDYYKLQNKDDKSTVINSSYFYQKNDSILSTNTISLNGGILRNDIDVTLDGQNCHADILGLYLMNRQQHVDNQVFVDHVQPNSYSNEMFKGIIDDSAKAVFNGHIKVRKDSQNTNTYQSNNNIQLTENALVTAKPFLEIYADDVKCSHGATVGQLDPEAMFYLKSRGICEHNARMLMMYAFAAQVVNHIQLEALRERIDNMEVKRLKGELSVCDQCVLHCKDERQISFNIDSNKI